MELTISRICAGLAAVLAVVVCGSADAVVAQVGTMQAISRPTGFVRLDGRHARPIAIRLRKRARAALGHVGSATFVLRIVAADTVGNKRTLKRRAVVRR